MGSTTTFRTSKEAEETARYVTNYVSQDWGVFAQIEEDVLKSIKSISKGTQRKKNEVKYPVWWGRSPRNVITAASKLRKYYSKS
jgi:hypothetical protein